MNNQKAIKVIGNFMLIGCQNGGFILFDFVRNNLNSKKTLLVEPLLIIIDHI